MTRARMPPRALACLLATSTGHQHSAAINKVTQMALPVHRPAGRGTTVTASICRDVL